MNLDELNALVGTALSDQDRATILSGLMLGCNAGTLPEQCSQLVHNAYQVGRGWRNEAQDFVDNKSVAGKASARARKLKFGDSNPRTNREQIVNSVHKNPEQAVNQSTTYNLNIKELATNMETSPSLVAIPSTPSLVPKKSRKLKTANPLGIPSHLVADLGTIVSRWPRKSMNFKGGVYDLPKKIATGSHLYERIVKFFPHEDVDQMVAVAIAYLNSLDSKKGDAGMVHNACALTNFFGEAAKWKENLSLVLDPESAQPKMVFISTNPED